MQLHMFINLISVSFGPVHTKFNSSTKYESTKYPTQPRAVVAVQPRPRPCYRVYMIFLIHTPKGWIQLHMFINPMLVAVWPLHSTCYWCKYESNAMTHPTKSQSTQTKSQTMLQSLYVLPHPYS
jgi:hypothetical protein